MTLHRAAVLGLGRAVLVTSSVLMLVVSCDGCDIGLRPFEDAGSVALWDAGADAGHPPCGEGCDDAGFEPDGGSSDAGPRDSGSDDAGPKESCDTASATGIFLSADEVTRHLTLEKYPIHPSGLGYLGFLRSYLRRIDGADILFLTLRNGELRDEERSYGSSNGLFRTLVLMGGGNEAAVVFERTTSHSYLHLPAVNGGLLALSSAESAADDDYVATAHLLEGDGVSRHEFRLSGHEPTLQTPLYMNDGSILLTGATMGPATLTIDGLDLEVSGGQTAPDAIVVHLSADGDATIVDLGISNSDRWERAIGAWATGGGSAIVVVHRIQPAASQGATVTNEHILLGISPTGGVAWRASIAYPADAAGQAAAVARAAPTFFVNRGSDACAFVPFFDGPMRVEDAMGDVMDVGANAPSWPRMTTAVLCFSPAGALITTRVLFPDWLEPSRGNSQTPVVRSDGHTWLFATLEGTATLQNGEEVTALGGADALALEFDQSFDLLSVSQLKAPGDVWATDVVVEEDTALLLVTSRSCWTAGDLAFPQPPETEEHLRVLKLPLP